MPDTQHHSTTTDTTPAGDTTPLPKQEPPLALPSILNVYDNHHIHSLIIMLISSSLHFLTRTTLFCLYTLYVSNTPLPTALLYAITSSLALSLLSSPTTAFFPLPYAQLINFSVSIIPPTALTLFLLSNPNTPISVSSTLQLISSTYPPLTLLTLLSWLSLYIHFSSCYPSLARIYLLNHPPGPATLSLLEATLLKIKLTHPPLFESYLQQIETIHQQKRELSHLEATVILQQISAYTYLQPSSSPTP